MKSVQKTAVNLLLQYLSNNPMEKLPKMLSIAEKMDSDNLYASQIKTIREVLLDENSVWHGFAEDLFRDIDLKLLKKAMECFFVNANLAGGPIKKEMEEKYDCNIPWAILMDPTSACNLSCTGCWAAQYGDKNNLSFETLDSICKQGKELGTYFYIFSGGEPLVRKKDIIRLCEANQDCYFFAFTNGTLVDDAFCEDMLRVGNFTLAFSIEGDEDATDMRRGAGTYQKVIAAMERMRKHKLLFGYSTCYHRYNTESVGSDTFVDDMIRRGCRFSWNITYLPLGKDAVLICWLRPSSAPTCTAGFAKSDRTKALIAMDFWNDGEFTQGCIAGGRNYLHINATGDIEPLRVRAYSMSISTMLRSWRAAIPAVHGLPPTVSRLITII